MNSAHIRFGSERREPATQLLEEAFDSIRGETPQTLWIFRRTLSFLQLEDLANLRERLRGLADELRVCQIHRDLGIGAEPQQSADCRHMVGRIWRLPNVRGRPVDLVMMLWSATLAIWIWRLVSVVHTPSQAKQWKWSLWRTPHINNAVLIIATTASLVVARNEMKKAQFYGRAKLYSERCERLLRLVESAQRDCRLEAGSRSAKDA